MRAAHIMIAAKKSDPEEEIMNASKKINEIYEKLKKGENFESLAKEFSDDPSSNQKGGELEAFGTGTSFKVFLYGSNDEVQVIKGYDQLFTETNRMLRDIVDAKKTSPLELGAPVSYSTITTKRFRPSKICNRG